MLAKYRAEELGWDTVRKMSEQNPSSQLQSDAGITIRMREIGRRLWRHWLE